MAEGPRLREGDRLDGRRRPLRRGLLRHLRPRGRLHGPSAADLPGDLLARSGARGPSHGSRCRRLGRCLRRQRRCPHQLPPRGAEERRATGRPHGLAGAARDRQGLSRHPGVVQAQPDRSQPDGANGVLHIPGRGAPRRPEPVARRVRGGTGRRREHPTPARHRLLAPPGRHPVAGRPLPPLRRQRAGNDLRQRRGRRRPETPRRRASRR